MQRIYSPQCLFPFLIAFLYHQTLSNPLSIFDLQLFHQELGTHYTYLNSHDPTPLIPLRAGDGAQGPVRK